MNFDLRLVVLVVVSVIGAGCGPSVAEREALQREKMKLEETQRSEADAANRAITEMNRKMFGRKAPSLDLGLPPDAKAKPEPKPTP